ncbi:MAG: c-type cytochrome [Gemmatimonadetes bacterium]|nr:c-type cytochrome [Gemmatimonadota bacterium]
MWQTNLKVIMLGALVIGFYTYVAHIIPQLQSEVPAPLDLSGDLSPEVLVAAGDALFSGAGACTACHGLGTRAPNIRSDHAGEGSIGQRCGSRKPGMDCKSYLYESLTDPSVHLVDGFTAIMPDARRQLSDDQIWAIVAYLQSLGGEVTVTAADVGGGTQAGTTQQTGPPAAASFSASTDPTELLTQNACLGCHPMDGAGPPIGPSFDGMGSRLSADRIRRGILDPGAEVAEGFEQFAGIMPPTFGQSLSAQQLEIIVQVLAGRR